MPAPPSPLERDTGDSAEETLPPSLYHWSAALENHSRDALAQYYTVTGSGIATSDSGAFAARCKEGNRCSDTHISGSVP